MKAIKIHGAESLTIEDIPIPEPGKGEVRVRMRYGGICGSDLHYYFQGKNGEYEVVEPFTPGHEMSGVVDFDPSGAFEPGTPVAIAPATYGTPVAGVEHRRHLWPGGTYFGSASTRPHTQGGMQEYRVVSDFMLRRVPEGVPLELASLAEPLAVALHAIRLAGNVEGARVLVTGSGPIGLCLIGALVAKGAVVESSDVLSGPLDRARALGAAAVFRSGHDTIPSGAYDLVFECSGVAPAITTALDAVRRAGTVVQVGMTPNVPLPVTLAPLISKEVTYLGTFRFDDEIDEALELLAAHPTFAQVITHVIPADDIVAAFDVAKDSEQSGKVVVSLWPEA